MNDLLGVDVLDTRDKLVNVVARFNLVKPLSTTYQVTERLVVANVEHDVHILFVLEVLLEVDYELVLHGSVDFNLRSQLLSRFRPLQVLFRHNFKC